MGMRNLNSQTLRIGRKMTKTSYIENVQEQIEILEKISTKYSSDFLNKNLRKFKEMLQNEDLNLIVFFGIGSSYFVSLYGKHLLLSESLPFEVQVHEASQLQNYFHNYYKDKNCLFVPISASGESVETLKSLKILKEKSGAKSKYVCITNSPNSSIAEISDVLFLLNAGKEIGATTKTYTSSLALIKILSEYLSEKRDRDSVIAASGCVKSIIEKDSESQDFLCEYINNSDHLYVLGRGLTLPTVKNAGLMLNEICYITSTSTSIRQFVHGIAEEVDDGFRSIMMLDEGTETDLRLKRKIEEYGGDCLIMSSNKKINPDIKLRRDNKKTLPITDIVYWQLACHKVAEKRGLEAGELERTLYLKEFLQK